MNLFSLLAQVLPLAMRRPATVLSYDEVFATPLPDGMPSSQVAPVVGDGEAWFHEVFAGTVF